MTVFRTRCFRVALLVFLLLPSQMVLAEWLPTEGTFRGIYDENSAGVGRFHFFIVPARLTKDLAPFKGKYIELEVLAGRQPFNPGPAIIEKIGKITELKSAPLGVEIKTVVPGSGGPDTFDILYLFRNTSQQTVVLDVNTVGIGLEQQKTADHANDVDRFFGTGYTRKQLAYGGGTGQRGSFLFPGVLGHPIPGFPNEVHLEPGEAAPFVWNSLRNDAGQSDFVVSASYWPGKNEPIPILVRKSLKLPLAAQKEPRPTLTVRAKVSRQEEWLAVEGRLTNETGKPRSVLVLTRNDEVLLPGLLRLLDKGGEPLSPYLERNHFEGPWVCREVDREGLAFRFRIRVADRFSRVQEDRLDFWLVTDAGLEKLTVARNLPPRAIPPEPPWGKEDKGCRLRILPAKSRFGPNEAIRCDFQAESDLKTADILWINRGNFRNQVVIEIDGKPAGISSHNLSDEHVHPFPIQGAINLASDLRLTPGKHKLKLTLKGDAGTYTNLNKVQYRQFDGTLISNEAEFEVRE